jgi:hypothetical protein
MTPRFLLALAVSASVILSAPFIRDIRDWIKTTFPGHYVAVVVAIVGLAVAAALAIAIVRIRDRRAARYGAIAAAVVLATAYALWNAQGNLEVDAVERFHFVEYGLVTFLFYRAFRPFGDLSVLVLPVLAGLLVGTCEEWLQWFIPGRVGDVRDVFLNGAAIVSGLLFSIGVQPLPELSSARRSGSLRRIGFAAALVVLVFALFVRTVHLGVEVDDPDIGRFRSRYDAATLLSLARERSRQWGIAPPVNKPASLSREDQYLSEGHLHVAERNRQWSTGNILASWSENVILEKYYAPVLDTPSYQSKTGHRWPDAQRADGQQRFQSAPRPAAPYVSLADVAEGKHFIRIWPRTAFWTLVALAIAGLLAITFVADRR